jgi:hypothetical protein
MTTGAVSHALKTQLRIVTVSARYRAQSLLEFLGHCGAAHGGPVCKPSRSRHEKAVGDTAETR